MMTMMTEQETVGQIHDTANHLAVEIRPYLGRLLGVREDYIAHLVERAIANGGDCHAMRALSSIASDARWHASREADYGFPARWHASREAVLVRLPEFVSWSLHGADTYLRHLGERIGLQTHIERKEYGDADDGSDRCVMARIGSSVASIHGAMSHARISAGHDGDRPSIVAQIESDRTFGQKVAQ